MLTAQFWKNVTENQTLRETLPPEVHPFLDMSFAEIEALPVMTESWDKETVCRPRLDVGEITASYLEFLRGEVRLRPKAAHIYQARLDALIPYEGKDLYQLVLHWPKKKFCIVMIRPDDFKVVHIE